MKKVGKFLFLPVPLLIFIGLSFAVAIAGASIYYQSYLYAAIFTSAVRNIDDLSPALENIPDILAGHFIEIVTYSTTIAALAFFFFWYRRLIKKESAPVTRVKLFRVKNIIFLIMAALGLQLLIAGLMELILPYFEKLSESYYELMEEAFSGNPILMFIDVVILAPISEELIFRGVTMKKALKLAPFAAANIIQAVLFGIAHMNLVQGLYAFLGGLAMGYVAYKFKTIKASILLHMFFNGLNYILMTPGTDLVKFIYVGVGAALVIPALLLIKKSTSKPEAYTIQAETFTQM